MQIKNLVHRLCNVLMLGKHATQHGCLINFHNIFVQLSNQVLVEKMCNKKVFAKIDVSQFLYYYYIT